MEGLNCLCASRASGDLSNRPVLVNEECIVTLRRDALITSSIADAYSLHLFDELGSPDDVFMSSEVVWEGQDQFVVTNDSFPANMPRKCRIFAVIFYKRHTFLLEIQRSEKQMVIIYYDSLPSYYAGIELPQVQESMIRAIARVIDPYATVTLIKGASVLQSGNYWRSY